MLVLCREIFEAAKGHRAEVRLEVSPSGGYHVSARYGKAPPAQEEQFACPLEALEALGRQRQAVEVVLGLLQGMEASDEG